MLLPVLQVLTHVRFGLKLLLRLLQLLRQLAPLRFQFAASLADLVCLLLGPFSPFRLRGQRFGDLLELLLDIGLSGVQLFGAR